MSRKQFKSALRRLSNGVPVYRKGRPAPERAVFRLAHSNGKFQGIVSDEAGGLIAIWECRRLDWLRRLACGYHSSLAKSFGPARNFVGT
jgi:hypothetical protein